MSVSFDIQSSIANYRVVIENGAFAEVQRQNENSVVLCDNFFETAFSGNAKVIAVPANEETKSLKSVPEIIIKMRDLALTRQAKLTAVGGGSLQDIATFCASIYMRGIKWDYIPTTLLGMVDSCIGGKSSINVGRYKNLVGNFHPPETIIIDPNLVKTLNAEQKIAGLCEAVKICYAKGSLCFSEYMQLNPQMDMNVEGYADIIELSLKAKKWFIEIDEFDKAERLLLNFGHTFGHALEGASNFEVSHGIAVGLGMLIAINYAQVSGGLKQIPADTQQLKDYVVGLLDQIPTLKEIIRRIDVEKVFECFISDKKHSASHFIIISVNDSGALERLFIDKTQANIVNLKSAISSVISQSYK
ncbi:3-dehydroquinate synthase [Methylomonas sp. 11b]|uniref:3-dehydroquinate synthase n=1 Tax=Methylomonas sp. 11b TaxID=1168169 RepID=UPI00047BC06B|nr:3-dehydroquinate synthase family protein [Methylomonas sp. 11b]